MLPLIVLLLLAACNLPDLIESAPPPACAQIGAQCQFPGGPLGVCQSAPCSAGQTPPCFVCTPQH